MVSQIAAKTMTAENFIRSTTDPSTSATVIAAKVIWKQMKTYSGIATPAVKVAAVVLGDTPLQERLAEAGDHGVAAIAERHRIAPANPDQHRESSDGADLGHHRKHVLGPGEAAVEKGEAGHDHHQHQHRRRQHPGGVALVDRRCRRCGSGLRPDRRGREAREREGSRSAANVGYEFHRFTPLTAHRRSARRYESAQPARRR